MSHQVDGRSVDGRAGASALGDGDVLELDDAMRQWLQREVIAGSRASQRLERLAEALTSPRFGLQPIDFPEPTPTAAQAFATRRANCVGFAALFASLARELEVPVYFVLLPRVETGERWNGLQVFEDHLVVAAGIGRRVRYYDQSGRVDDLLASGEAVSDLRLLSIFASNRGVETLATGDASVAVGHLERAVRLDPGHATAWVNLGVARRRVEDFLGAERALRLALDVRPGTPGAVHNLASLLTATGREEEALRLVRVWATPDPLDALHEAEGLLARGDLAGARQLYARALKLSQ